MTIIDNDRRRIIFPIDGSKHAADVLAAAGDLHDRKDLLPWIGAVKLNDALHIPSEGPDILAKLKRVVPSHVRFFIDLKIFDVSATIINTLRRYAEYEPDIVTVCSQVTAEGLLAVRKALPRTKIALVDTLTDMSIEECFERYRMSPMEKMAQAISGFNITFARLCKQNPIDMIVCSVDEVRYLRESFGGDRFEFICPGIRDAWMFDGDNKDHQERVSGIYDALSAGATYVVMGSQLTKGNPKAGISADESVSLTVAELERYFSETSI